MLKVVSDVWMLWGVEGGVWVLEDFRMCWRIVGCLLEVCRCYRIVDVTDLGGLQVVCG